MLDANNIVNSIQQIAVNAVETSKPTAVVFGTVISIAPLKINVEQKLTLTSAQLVLSRNVTDFQTEISFDNPEIKQPIKAEEVEITDTVILNGITYSGVVKDKMLAKMKFAEKIKHEITVYNALKPGEEVVLIRLQGGQKFIVLDRVVKA